MDKKFIIGTVVCAIVLGIFLVAWTSPSQYTQEPRNVNQVSNTSPPGDVLPAPQLGSDADRGKVPTETRVLDKKASNAARMPTELQKEDIVIGNGPEAMTGKQVWVNYTGKLTDGTVFDSSYKRSEPFSFTLGSGQVIPGWEQGIVGMKVGGKRTLTISPTLAYGPNGVPGAIPPNAVLIFEVELLKVQ